MRREQIIQVPGYPSIHIFTEEPEKPNQKPGLPKLDETEAAPVEQPAVPTPEPKEAKNTPVPTLAPDSAASNTKPVEATAKETKEAETTAKAAAAKPETSQKVAPKPTLAPDSVAQPVGNTVDNTVSAPKTQNSDSQGNENVTQLAAEIDALRNLYAQIEELEGQRTKYAGKPYSSANQKEIDKLTAQIYALGKDYAVVENSIYGISDNIRIALEEKEKQFNSMTGGPREATWKDVTLNAISRGYNNAKFGEESYKDMIGKENEKDTYQEILDSEKYNYQAYGLLKKAVSGAAELFGQQIRQWTHPETIASGGAAAATAYFLGKAGLQAAVPEELLTVPGAHAAGTKAASAKLAYQMEAGFAYNEMVEKGVSKETAKTIAKIIGAANAALEFAQLDELCDAYKLTTKTGAKTTSKFILDILEDYGIYLGKETGTEIAQESVTMLGVQAGTQIDKGESAYTWDEVQQRLKDTGRDSLLSFGLMGAPAVGKNVYSVTQNKNIGWDGREVATEATGSKITVDGVTYELLGYDEKGLPVYQDAEVLREQNRQAEESQAGETEPGKKTEDGILKTPGELGEKAVPYSERGIEIEPRITEYLGELQNNADYIERSAGEIKTQDLAILTTETGVEFTMVTVDGKDYLIRGDEKGTTIPSELVDTILNKKGAISCHSHPFIGDLMPSESDLDFLKRLTWQTESVIVDPTQRAVRFTVDGSVETFVLENTRDGDYYNRIFGGGE